MQTKPLTQVEILSKILVSTRYTLKVLGGFVISGLVSVFGLYPLVASFFTSETALYITIFGFIGLLTLMDSIKRSTLSRYFNSKLKNIILGSKIRRGYLNISMMAILFVVLIDGSGAWLTGVQGAKYYTENKTTDSTEFKILQTNAETGKAIASNFTLVLQTYNTSKEDAKAICNEKWKGWKAKYKATCKEEWNTANPMPVQTATGTIKIDDYKSIKEDNKSFLDEYLQYIIFTALMLLTGLLQYLTISEIKEDYEDLEDTLTPNRISNLQTALATAQDIEEQHERSQFKNKEDMQKRKNEQVRDMDDIADKREIVFNAKAISNGNDGLKRIANNNDVYVPTEEAKAGYVHNPFGKDESEEPNEDSEDYLRVGEICLRLWDSDRVKAGQKLTPKSKVINIKKRKHTTALADVYRTLVKLGYAELRGNKGYYALKTYDLIQNNRYEIENEVEGNI